MRLKDTHREEVYTDTKITHTAKRRAKRDI